MTRRSSSRAAALLAAVLLVLLVAARGANPAGAVDPVGTYTVTSPGNEADADLVDGTCRTSGGTCTLRAAIQQSQSDGVLSTVRFNLPGTGVQTIAVTGGGFDLNDSRGTIIDGYTQPGSSANTLSKGSNAVLRIQLDGDGNRTGADADGINLNSANNVVRGIALFDMGKPVNFYGPGANNNTIAGNFIGTNAAATFKEPVLNDATGGVIIQAGAHHNTIGGPNAADRNVISGNSAKGIYFDGAGSSDNVVRGNVIGLTPAGTGRLENGSHGIDVNAGASRNLIAGNVLSGNEGSGVEVSHPFNGGTFDNRVEDNFIGTDVTGASGSSATSNGVGSVFANVHVEDHVARTVVSGNTIGNSAYGGIKVDSGSVDTVISGNRIGVGVTGTALSNGPYGVQLEQGVTGSVVGAGNEIAFNQTGIRVLDAATDRNTITDNSIHDNTGVGIELGPTFGPTANDAGDGDTGANDEQNWPVLEPSGPQEVRATTCAGCRVEVFVADTTETTTFGEGVDLVGQGTADGSGVAVVALAPRAAGTVVSATATNPAGDTSEFSANVAMPSAPVDDRLAGDDFERTEPAGWGTADVGGTWTTGGTASFSVNGGRGRVSSVGPAATGTAHLPAVQSPDVELDARVGGSAGTTVALVARRREDGGAYAGRLRFGEDGQLHAALLANGALVGEEVTVPGITYSSGALYGIRFRVRSASPTHLDLRVWEAAATEPTTWLLSADDRTAQLQGSGSVGVETSSPATLLLPTRVDVDDFSARATSAK